MAKIRGDSLKPELRMAEALAASGVAFSRNARFLPGKPDFLVWPPGSTAATALFVHGCFWHCCPAHFRAPKTRAAHWREHFRKNVARDRRVRRQLNRLGYRTLAVWEHDLKTTEGAARSAARIKKRLEKVCSH